MDFAERADELTIDGEIAGVPVRLEGAANLPPRIVLASRATIKTGAYLDLDCNGELQVTMKRGLLRQAPEFQIEIEFERSKPLESLELLRDRANEVNKDNLQAHRVKLATALGLAEAAALGDAEAGTNEDLESEPD